MGKSSLGDLLLRVPNLKVLETQNTSCIFNIYGEYLVRRSSFEFVRVSDLLTFLTLHYIDKQ